MTHSDTTARPPKDRALERNFAEFVRTNTAALARTAYLLTGSRTAAEELVQDTLVALYPKWERVARVDEPLPYVRRSVTNRFLNQQRGARRETLTDAVPDRPNERLQEDDIVDRDEIWALLRTLGERQRAALVLRYYEGLNDVEIAANLGCRPGTARSLVSRGLATLRQQAQS